MERPYTAIGRAARAETPPSCVATLPGGELVITAHETHQLLVISVSGELRNVVDPAGEFLTFPTGCACDNAALFVVDGLGDRVHKFSLPRLQHVICSELSGYPNFPDLLHYPQGACTHRASGKPALLYVADWGHHRIVALDSENLRECFSFGRKGSAPGEFMYPRGVASLAPADELCVTDTDNNRLQLFSCRGEPLRVIGGISQPYAAVAAPGGCEAGPDTVFIAMMNGQLRLKRLAAEPRSSANGADIWRADDDPSRVGLDRDEASDEEMSMPTGGRLRCGLCTDGRRVYIACLDEEQQLHILAARGGVHPGASRPASRGLTAAAVESSSACSSHVPPSSLLPPFAAPSPPLLSATPAGGLADLSGLSLADAPSGQRVGGGGLGVAKAGRRAGAAPSTPVSIF